MPGKRRYILSIALFVIFEFNCLVIGVYAQSPIQTFNYTIKQGDTLSKIAAKYYVSVDTIMQRNSIENRNMIFKGEVLAIPITRTGRFGPVMLD